MPYVKSLRDVRVATLSGHIHLIQARVPAFVPASSLPDCFAAGCVECDEGGSIVGLTDEQAAAVARPVEPEDIKQPTPEERADPNVRREAIRIAVAKVYADNDRDDFTKDNIPKTRVVQKLVGFPITAADISEAIEVLND